MKKIFINDLLVKIATEIGASITIEPEFEYVGCITFKNGKNTFFKRTILDINNDGAAKIAKDKDYTSFFLRKLGYTTPSGETFFEDSFCKVVESDRDIEKGLQYAKSLGYPVILKPNDRSLGINVFKVHNDEQYYEAAKAIFNKGKVMLIQEFCRGNDYRVVVFDKNIEAVYQRVPLNIVGDGVSTVRQLLNEKYVLKKKSGRIEKDDKRIYDNLNRQGLDYDSILEKGRRVYLLDNANLTSGGDAIDLTEHIHPDFAKLAIEVTDKMGLSLCGVDIIAEDITKPLSKSNYVVLELNSSPGINNFAYLGDKQMKIVENLYRKILLKLENELY